MSGRYLISGDLAQQLNDALRQLRHTQPQRSYPQRRQHITYTKPGISFFNDSGETIPANAVMRVTDQVATSGFQEYYTVAKPNSTPRPLYLVNRGVEVPYGMGDSSYGFADWLIDPAGRALYDSGSGTPAYGETWGPSDGSWLLKKNEAGFVIVGGSETTEDGNPCTWAYQTLPTTQNYVEYSLGISLNGFDTSGSNPKLNATHTSGWTGSATMAGSESSVGVEYQTSETAPQTNGLYKITKDGLFRITIFGQPKLRFTGTRTPAAQTNVTTGPESAGTPHTHSVVPVGFEAVLGSSGPEVYIELFNKKSSGGANAIHANALGYFARWFATLPNLLSGERFIPVHAQWNVCLSKDDKVSLKWRMATATTNHELLLQDGDPMLMRFEYIGAKQDWSAI